MVDEFFNNPTEAENFWDYYQSNGWKVGRNPMKDWEAAASKWKRNNYGTNKKRSTESSRSAGTLNEGKASDQGVGKVSLIFQTFNDPQLDKMKVEAARFITAFQNHDSPYWLSFLGNSGVGKTFLATQMRCDIWPWYEIIA